MYDKLTFSQYIPKAKTDIWKHNIPTPGIASKEGLGDNIH